MQAAPQAAGVYFSLARSRSNYWPEFHKIWHKHSLGHAPFLSAFWLGFDKYFLLFFAKMVIFV